jgi:hypothetical protein
VHIHKKSLGLAIGLSLFSYIFGGVNNIAAYNDGTGIPQFKVISGEILYVVSLMTIYYLIFISIKKDKNFIFLIWPAGLLATFPLYYSLFPIFMEHRGTLSTLYLTLGDYLAQKHNINWYFMDWGVWEQAFVLYFWLTHEIWIISVLLNSES